MDKKSLANKNLPKTDAARCKIAAALDKASAKKRGAYYAWLEADNEKRRADYALYEAKAAWLKAKAERHKAKTELRKAEAAWREATDKA